MKVAITGQPLSGKSTLFNALTGQSVPTNVANPPNAPRHVGVVRLPDPRLDWLHEHYKGSKKVELGIDLVDAPGLPHGDAKGKGELTAALREADALLVVLPAFEGGEAPPDVALRTFREDLALSDLDVVERKLDALAKKTRTRAQATELERYEEDVLGRVKAAIEQGTPARTAIHRPEDEKAIRSYGLLSLKPVVACVNRREAPGDEAAATAKAIAEADAGVSLCAKFEEDLRAFEGEEREALLREVGLVRPGVHEVGRSLVRGLGVLMFLTAGPNEVRSWPLRAGSSAVEAAGSVHTDMARGFIRAECMAFEDLKKHGSEKEVKAHGRFRLEGRDYVVKDGDILLFRFHV